MTTKHSSPAVLQAQADAIASMLKAIDRGETINMPFAAKIAAARGREQLKFAIAMDDKFISIEILWATIRSASEPELAGFIVKQMREDTTQ